jgi:KaiC/GvpD/RAD55 family RecA-like ATPase
MVSLTKPSSTLVESFRHSGIDPKKFFIVDAVSQTAGGAEKVENAVFVTSPAAITELGIKIGEAFKKEKFDFLLFDSISVLLIYVAEQEVLKFIHMLVSRFRASRTCALFTVLLEDTETRVVRNICMFADAVIDLGGGR